MLGNLMKSTFGVIGDVATVAVAPVAIVAELARTVTKPVAEAAEVIVETVGDLTKK